MPQNRLGNKGVTFSFGMVKMFKGGPPPLISYFPHLNTNNCKNWQKVPLESKIEDAVFEFLKKIMGTPKSAKNIKLWGNF